MARIVVSRKMNVPQRKVWDAIAGLDSHPDWMKDAISLVFVGEKRRGVGTRMRVDTRVGPLRTVDVLEVVGWDEGSSIEVAHQGLVRGRGRLSATSDDGKTVVTWDEELSFPWWLGGGIAGWIVRPLLAGIWRGNLRRLEESLRSP